MSQFLRLLKEEDCKDAYTQIYQIYADELYIHIFKRVRDEAIAEDILQELFIQLWERRANQNTEVDLKKYLFAAAKFKIIDYFKNLKSKSTQMDLLSEHLKNHSTENQEFLNTYLALEKMVDAEIQKMPQNMREIILLRWEKYSIKNIAEKLHLSEQTVKNNITEANKRLKNRIMASENQFEISLLVSFITVYLMDK